MTQEDGGSSRGPPGSHSRRSMLGAIAALGAGSAAGPGQGDAAAGTGTGRGEGRGSSGAAGRADATEIADWHDLDAVRDDLDGEYVLVADIDEDSPGYEELVGGAESGWDPIGDFRFGGPVAFRGVLDGNGHEIADLRVDRPATLGVGLFAVTDGTVEGVTLVDCEVTGDYWVGGLVGYSLGGSIEESSVSGSVTGTSPVGVLGGTSQGTVSGCAASGTVTGTIVGGLLGSNFEGEVLASTADCTATGQDQAGGLVAQNEGTLADSSASSDVGGSLVGGLVGFNRDEITNSHYNIDEVSINGESRVTTGGLFDEQYQDWQETGSLDIDEYDSLETADGRVEVGTAQGMRDALGFTHDPGNSWRLVDDIDLSGDSPGVYIPYLAGDFDGNGHTVTLDVDTLAASVGCIGYNPGGEITGLTVEGAVSGTRYVGGVVGWNEGAVRESTASVTAVGDLSVGGLVGFNFQGDIFGSSASGKVIAGRNGGGLLGSNNDGDIAESSASGAVTSDRGAGGLVGSNNGTVVASSASGSVTGGESAGGLIGYHSAGDVRESFATGAVTGPGRVGGLAGVYGSGTLERSFAAGETEGDTAGGLVGQLGASTLPPDGQAVVRNAYWDTAGTGQNDAVGDIRSGDGEAGLAGVVTGLATAQMQGQAATENMTVFDFETTWQAVTDPPGYPVLILRPPSLPGFENPPADLDGDGLYEDVSGDGEFDIFDVQALFDNLDSAVVQDNARAFDFAGRDNNQVSVSDVQALFAHL